MKLVIRLAAPCLVGSMLVNCSPTSGSSQLAVNQPVGTGPFCSRGNYVDDWADDPSKWRQDSPRQTTPSPVMASVDELPVIAAVDQPPPTSIPITTSAPSPVPRISSQTATTTVKATPKPAAKPAPKTAAKPKPKAPAVTRHIVKKGDTLSAIARRHNSTVATIQKANKLSGTLIHPGKSLVIPR